VWRPDHSANPFFLGSRSVFLRELKNQLWRKLTAFGSCWREIRCYLIFFIFFLSILVMLFHFRSPRGFFFFPPLFILFFFPFFSPISVYRFSLSLFFCLFFFFFFLLFRIAWPPQSDFFSFLYCSSAWSLLPFIPGPAPGVRCESNIYQSRDGFFFFLFFTVKHHWPDCLIFFVLGLRIVISPPAGFWLHFSFVFFQICSPS